MTYLIALIILIALAVGAFYWINKAPYQDAFANAENPKAAEPTEEEFK